MTSFEYYAPTRVVFGPDTEREAGRLVRDFGGKKALLHYGGRSAEESGLLGRIRASLAEAGVPCVELGGVQPNPRLSLVRQGLDLCRAEQVDFVLAVGGGSVIDSAKAIAYGLANGGDVWDFYAGTRKAEAAAPVGVVLTIAAAGSEMSNSSVITNDDTREKRGYSHDTYGRVRFAVMNPALTLTVPPYHTAAGCADILMHTMERYFTAGGTMELTDGIAEALLRTVMANARTLMRSPANYDARAEVMWASSLSHNGLTGCGGGAGDWAPHQLSHEIAGLFDVAHGATLTMVWGAWARYVYKTNPARFAQLALRVMELPDEGTDEELALAAIEEMEGFFWAIEMPTSMAEAGLAPTDEQLRQMAAGCSRGGKRTIGGFQKLDEADMEAIYKMARG